MDTGMEIFFFVAIVCCGFYGYILGGLHREEKIGKSFEEYGRCYIGEDIYHVMLVNGEVPGDQPDPVDLR